MNKLLILLTLIAGSTVNLTHAWKAILKNETDSTYKVKVEFSQQGTCGPETWVVYPNKTTEKATGGDCCFKPGIKFKGTGGKYKGKETTFDSPTSSPGLRCKNFTAIIKESGDEFVVEQED